MNKAFDRLIDGWVGTFLMVGAVVLCVVIAVQQLTDKRGPDYCALANMRSCTVQDHGDWILVTDTIGNQHMIYMQNGKVLQVQ